MIISHQHHFVFFEIPRTASTAIAKLLVEQYDGIPFGRKHTSYAKFSQMANATEQRYFKFAGIRNPLDSFVSHYFKLKNDHSGLLHSGRTKDGRPRAPLQLEKFRFIQSDHASFEDFFLRYGSQEYWFKKRHETVWDNMDFLIRFEHLNEDFKMLTQRLNLPFHPISRVNPTAGRAGDFTRHFTPAIIPGAMEIFGPQMKKWGYDFPQDWRQFL